MTLLIFHNRSAGSGETTREELLDAFADAGFDARYGTKDDARPGDASGAETIVIAGGDGTVISAFDRFADFSGTFAIVPLGGANNIATSLGVRGGPREIARGLRQGRRRRFCLGRLQGCGLGPDFVEAVGFGALAGSLVSAAANKGGGDKIRVGRETLAGRLRKAAPMRSTIAVDGAELPGEALFAEVLNVGVTGPSLHLAPGFEAGGGALAVAWLPEAKRDAFAAALLDEAPLPHEVVRARSVKVAWRADALRIDDDFPEATTPEGRLWIHAAQRWVELIIPAESSEGEER